MLKPWILRLALASIAAVIAIAAIASAVSFLTTALANALVAAFGPIYGYLAAGGIILLPFLIAMLGLYLKIRQASVPTTPPVTHTIARSLISAVAREAPWIAAAGAAAVAAGEVFLNRKRRP